MIEWREKLITMEMKLYNCQRVVSAIDDNRTVEGDSRGNISSNFNIEVKGQLP